MAVSYEYLDQLHVRLEQKLSTVGGGGGGYHLFQFEGGGITYFNLGRGSQKKVSVCHPLRLFSGIALREFIYFYKFLSEFVLEMFSFLNYSVFLISHSIKMLFFHHKF